MFVGRKMNQTIEVILNRKSVRKYTESSIEKDKIELILRAGMAAPSACNVQPWDFVVVDDEKVLKELGENNPYAKMLLNCKLAIVVCGNLEKTMEGEGQQFWIQDCSAATQNILLAAESLGIGAVWTAVYPSEDRMKSVSQILSLPNNIIPLNVIPMGYPSENQNPKDKYIENNIHLNRW